MRYLFSVETKILEMCVFQNFVFYNKEWFDEQYKISLIRKWIINECKLNLKLIGSEISHYTVIIKYDLSDENENVNKFDGKFYYYYRKPKFKGCLNCVSFNRLNRFCSWKDRMLIQPIRYCDGFLEK